MTTTLEMDIWNVWVYMLINRLCVRECMRENEWLDASGGQTYWFCGTDRFSVFDRPDK